MDARTDARYGLQEFIDDVRAVTSRKSTPSESLRSLGPGFRRLLSNHAFLQEKLDALGTFDDEVCLHEDPDQRFVILARGVKRGQSHAGSPHDHGPLWALYGIYEGSARFQRYTLDPTSKDDPFPGLRLLSETPAKAGDFDAVEPRSMHLPVFPPEGGSVIIVVYDGQLDSVVRQGYLRETRQPVKFKGQFPSRNTIVAEPV
jgi:predicted metal-dependent enzyme (double-stranded beta helix superfamily)